MKAKNQDISVRELFRRKLENATVIPDCTVSSKLMRKLAVREFVRFNPARFNIYYLAGILVAGLTAAVLLYSFNGKPGNKIPPVIISDTSGKTSQSGYISIPAGPVIVQAPGKKESPTNVKENVISKPEIKTASEKEPGHNIQEREKSDNALQINRSSVSNKIIFSEPVTDIKTLKKESNKNEVLFESSSVSGCIPLRIHFYSKVSPSDSCNWVFGDGGISHKKDPDWIFDVDGEYNVVLQVFDHNVLKASYSSVITVYPRPHARFEISPEKAVIPDDQIRFVNYSTDGAHYLWNFGDGSTSDQYEPVHSYARFGKYNVSLIVLSESGCSDSLTVMNAFSGSEYFIDFPNAFIPNKEGPSGGYYSLKSDEATQVFHPSFSGVSDYQLKIFSKLGILIFESNDVGIGWDGYFKGQLSNPGVYIWKVRGSFRNGEPFTRMGDVTLLGY